MTNQENKNQKPKSDKPKKSGAFKFLIFAAVFYVIFAVVVIFAFRTEGSKDLDRVQFCYDYWDVFSDEQETDLNTYCKKIQKKTGLTIFVSTCERKERDLDDRFYYEDSYRYYADMTGDEFRHEHDLTFNDNCAVIIINTRKNGQACYDYHFDIYTYGEAYDKISDGEIEAILFSEGGDLILTSTSENAVEGVKGCVKLTGVAYKWLIPGVGWMPVSIGAIVISAIISLIVIVSIRKSYTRERKNQTFSFASNSKLNLSVKNDNYIRSTTTYTRIHTSSGGSGRGFSGGFSGGRSGGGGGGGHRGGR